MNEQEKDMACSMTLRDYFAAEIINGLVRFPTQTQPEHVGDNLARRAYALADAMLAERERDK